MKGNEMQYRIKTISDIAALEPNQRERCLVDLASWMVLRDEMQPFVDDGVMDPIEEMIWVDDNRTGEVSGIRMIDRNTGETLLSENW